MSAEATKLTDLPEALPQGEVVLWQGKPSCRSLAVRAFHVRKVGIYFGIILAWWTALGLYKQAPPTSISTGALTLVLLALSAIGISALLAWLYCKTTTYTITNRRIFMRYGVALPMMLNIPYRIVGSAAAQVHRDGTADIPLHLTGSGRVSYLHLWPHARPWHLKTPEPMLRSIPDGARVAALLAAALTAAPPPPVSQAVRVVPGEQAGTEPEPTSANIASAAA